MFTSYYLPGGQYVSGHSKLFGGVREGQRTTCLVGSTFQDILMVSQPVSQLFRPKIKTAPFEGGGFADR